MRKARYIVAAVKRQGVRQYVIWDRAKEIEAEQGITYTDKRRAHLVAAEFNRYVA